MGFYMSAEERRQPLVVAWHYFFMFQMTISLASLAYGILESLDDIVLLGQDLAFTIGVRKIKVTLITYYITYISISDILHIL